MALFGKIDNLRCGHILVWQVRTVDFSSIGKTKLEPDLIFGTGVRAKIKPFKNQNWNVKNRPTMV
jgi:hypothetical protein